MIVTNSTEFQITRRVQGLAVLAGDSVMELRRLDAASAGVSDRAVGGAGAAAQLSLRVSLEHGLHARPAALRRAHRTRIRCRRPSACARPPGQRPQRRRADVARCAPQRRHRHRGRRPGRRARRRGPRNDPARALRARVARNERAADDRATCVCVPTVLLPGAELAGVVASPGFAVGRPFASCGASAMSRSTGTGSRTRHWNSTVPAAKCVASARARRTGRGPATRDRSQRISSSSTIRNWMPRRRVGSRRARAQHMRGAGPYARASMPCARSAMHGCAERVDDLLRPRGAGAGRAGRRSAGSRAGAARAGDPDRERPAALADRRAGPGRNRRHLHRAWRRDLARRDPRCGDADPALWCRWGPGSWRSPTARRSCSMRRRACCGSIRRHPCSSRSNSTIRERRAREVTRTGRCRSTTCRPQTECGSGSSRTSAIAADAARCGATRCRGLRPAAHRVPVPRSRIAPGEDEQAARVPARSSTRFARPAGRHPHARRRRRQADPLPADAARGQPRARLARRARRACGSPTCCARSCARSCAYAPIASCRILLPMISNDR